MSDYALRCAAQFFGRCVRQTPCRHDHQLRPEFLGGFEDLARGCATPDCESPFLLLADMPAPKTFKALLRVTDHGLVRLTPLYWPIAKIAKIVNRTDHMHQHQTSGLTASEPYRDFQRTR